MTVVCKVDGCPYKSKSSFCRKRVLGITNNGLCGHIYDNNGNVKVKWREPVDVMYMDGFNYQE